MTMRNVREVLSDRYEIVATAQCPGVRPIPVEAIPQRTAAALGTTWIPRMKQFVDWSYDGDSPISGNVTPLRAVAYGNWTFAIGQSPMASTGEMTPVALIATHVGLPLSSSVACDDDMARAEALESMDISMDVLMSKPRGQNGVRFVMAALEPGRGELMEVDVAAYADRCAFHVVSARVDSEFVSIFISVDANGRIDGILLLGKVADGLT